MVDGQHQSGHLAEAHAIESTESIDTADPDGARVITQQAIGAGRWWRIMPVLFLTYSFAYLDRVNFAFASAGGIGRDLGFSTGIVSFIAALFFLGYFCG